MYEDIKTLDINFNPRSREGSDKSKEEVVMAKKISIHAPAKGATVEDMGGYIEKEISIHAPAKGATFLCSLIKMWSSISIHAPAKGATIFNYISY